MKISTDELKKIQEPWEQALVYHIIDQAKVIVNKDLNEVDVGDRIKDFDKFQLEIKEILKSYEIILPTIVHQELNDRDSIEGFSRSFSSPHRIPKCLEHEIGFELGRIGDSFKKHGAHWTPSFGSVDGNKKYFVVEKDSKFLNCFTDELKLHQRTFMDGLKLWLKAHPIQGPSIIFD